MSLKSWKLSINHLVFSIPLPSSISYAWNFGSLLGLCLLVQLVTGILLTFHYTASTEFAFSSVISIMEDVNGGWLVRFMHANGASLFFVCIYAHISRGLYYKSFIHKEVWLSGVTILLILMGTAFLGYVLPWGQMSFWGATVITNLLSALPRGDQLVLWIWGGFSVDEPTLIRFFSFHYILPFIVSMMVMIHILFLHSEGSSNPLGVSNSSDKIYFHPYYTTKDILGGMAFIMGAAILILLMPDLFMDPDNWIPANPMITPPHIQPEWYFLFAYAILRSIPNKLGGVISLFMSIVFLYFLPFLHTLGGVFSVKWKLNFFIFSSVFLLLTWVGSMPVGGELVAMGQVCSILYFLSLGSMMLM